MNEGEVWSEAVDAVGNILGNVIHQDLTQLLSESVDLQDFHDKMALYFNEEE